MDHKTRPLGLFGAGDEFVVDFISDAFTGIGAPLNTVLGVVIGNKSAFADDMGVDTE